MILGGCAAMVDVHNHTMGRVATKWLSKLCKHGLQTFTNRRFEIKMRLLKGGLFLIIFLMIKKMLSM